jgi:hypothetical protein
VAEAKILVCDVCGEPAEQTVTYRLGTRSLAQDLCRRHLQELVRNSHAPRRDGRRRASSSSKSASRKQRSAKARSVPKASGPKRARKRITDPATLEKRRAALAKARQALAKKRASQKKAS